MNSKVELSEEVKKKFGSEKKPPKGSEAFLKTIQDFLRKQAIKDPLFAPSLQKEGKKIEDCITYIINTVQKSGCNGFAEDEIYGMAMHYYDEDKIDIGKSISNYQVVVNHVVELTPIEIEEAKKIAREKLVADEIKRMSEKQIKRVSEAQKPKPIKVAVVQPVIPISDEDGDDSFDVASFEVPKVGFIPKKDIRKPVPMKIVQGSLF